jgi:hypothetical protein
VGSNFGVSTFENVSDSCRIAVMASTGAGLMECLRVTRRLPSLLTLALNGLIPHQFVNFVRFTGGTSGLRVSSHLPKIRSLGLMRLLQRKYHPSVATAHRVFRPRAGVVLAQDRLAGFGCENRVSSFHASNCDRSSECSNRCGLRSRRTASIYFFFLDNHHITKVSVRVRNNRHCAVACGEKPIETRGPRKCGIFS